MQIPDDAEISECPQDIEREIYFPPVEAMTCRAWIEVMIIVPPVSKGEQSNKDIVPAPVRTLESARPKQMANRVDAVDRVVNEHSADKEPPRQHL